MNPAEAGSGPFDRDQRSSVTGRLGFLAGVRRRASRLTESFERRQRRQIAAFCSGRSNCYERES